MRPHPSWSLRAILVVATLEPAAAQLQWTQVQKPTSPALVTKHAMAWHPGSGTVLTGGEIHGDFMRHSSSTWSWNGAWNKGVNHVSRTDHAIAYDSARLELVLFGGATTSTTTPLLGDTWAWNGSTWQMFSVPGPPARKGHALAYDVARARTVLFGGQGASGLLSDTWEWDGSNWMQRTPTSSPTARASHAMAYDPLRQRLVLFGGAAGSTLLSDTWEWDGSQWQAFLPSVVPPARRHHAVVYHPPTGKVLLLGGVGTSTWADLWDWDGTTWQSAGSLPWPLADHAATWDAQRARLVVHGGEDPGRSAHYGDTWEWDGSSWTRSPGAWPLQRYAHSMVYDEAAQRTVMLGGTGTNCGTAVAYYGMWEWDGIGWVYRAVNAPWGPLAYDRPRQRILSVDSYNGVQEWNGASWKRIGPPPSVVGAIAYDDSRARLVSFGGDLGLADDTWEWDGAQWSLHRPATRPPPRSKHAAVYDPQRQRVVVWGGFGPMAWHDDTWEWDGSIWVERFPRSRPPARTYHAMAWDASRGRAVMFGGNNLNSSIPGDDTWEWDGNDWLFAPTSTSPGGHFWHAMAYDRSRGKIVMFGGAACGWRCCMGLSDLWEYPTATAAYGPFGLGCGSPGRIPSLAAAPGQSPRLGRPFTLQVTNLPLAQPAFLLFGASNQLWGSVPLPLDLRFVGMPGCWLLASPDLVLPLVHAGGSATLGFPICTCPVLLGMSWYNQAGAADPAANALGVALSNGGTAIIGS